MRTLTHRLALLGVCLCGLLLPRNRLGDLEQSQIRTSVSKGVTYLKGLQETSGGFPSDWDINSLAASGTAAANVKKVGAETDARTRYRKLLSNETATKWPKEALVTEYERAALVAYAAGIDPARVSKTQNLIAGIASYYQPESPGYYGPPGNFNGTVFALFWRWSTRRRPAAFSAYPTRCSKKSVEVIEKNQHTDGGWAWEKAEGNETKLKAAWRTGHDGCCDCRAVQRACRKVEHRGQKSRGLLERAAGCLKRRVRIGIRREHRLERLGGAGPRCLWHRTPRHGIHGIGNEKDAD